MRYHLGVPENQPPAPDPDAAKINAVLEALKTGIDAIVVGIFDGGRGWLHASSEKSPGTFWDSFHEIPCLEADWGDWDRELLASAYARVDCRCGTHRIEAFMFHKRWILIVLSASRFVVGADRVVAHVLEILKHLLPAAPVGRLPSPPVGGGSTGGGQGPAELGIPVWWIRDGKLN
jgi:hypothetical protein